MTVNGTCPECGADYQRTSDAHDWVCGCGWTEPVYETVDDVDSPATPKKKNAK